MVESNTFNIKRNEDLLFLTIPAFENTGLVNHCFSSRLGGVSKGEFESMNLGFNRGDTNENVKKNFNIICSAIDVNYEELIFSKQIHENSVEIVTKKDKGRGIIRNIDCNGVDALITNESKTPIVTFYADCVPIFFLDPIEKVIGLAHAGWKGTVKKIAKKTVAKMTENFQCKPSNILVAIAPSIGPCCFEVDQPVVDEFSTIFDEKQQEKIISKISDEKYIIDLWIANKIILLDAGVSEENISITDLCTKCHKDVFFSHRGSKGERGSLAAIMELR